jgi:integrase
MATRKVGQLHLLSTRAVQTAGEGDHHDGGGLVLRVRGDSATWVFRYTAPSGRRREMGLGAAYRSSAAVAGENLAAVRRLAHTQRELVRVGGDPIDARQADRHSKRASEQAVRHAQKREALTLARAARAYHARVIEPNRTTKHALQWINTLEQHVPQAIWHKSVDCITPAELLDFMVTLNAKVPETSYRVRQRIETVFDDLQFRGECVANPAAAIKRKLREHRCGRRTGHFAAMPFAQVPAFVATLRAVDAIGARCMEFCILTASRTGEAIGARWAEFDLAAGVWTVPGERMKGKAPHTVYLSPTALALVKRQQGKHPDFVFPSLRATDGRLSNMALLMQLRRMKIDGATVHGFRASFSTWAHETGAARPDVIEACLAHKEADRVRAAYNRAKFATDRAALLAAWARYVDGATTAEPANDPAMTEQDAQHGAA